MRTRQSKQLTARLPEPTLRQVAELTALYGSKTKALIAAIERLHQDEIARKEHIMNYIIIKHEGEEVGQVHTNRSLTKDETLELAGIDVNELDGGDPRWNYEAFEFEPLSEDEYKGRTMHDVELTVTIPTEEDHYTIDESDQHLLPELLDNQERKISEWLDKNYPGMVYEIERVPEKLSRNNRDRTYSDRAQQALERLNQYIEDNWFYWWPETYEHEIRSIQPGDHRHFGDTCVVIANEDGTYSVTDNGEEVRVNTAGEAAAILAENLVEDDD